MFAGDNALLVIIIIKWRSPKKPPFRVKKWKANKTSDFPSNVGKGAVYKGCLPLTQALSSERFIKEACKDFHCPCDHPWMRRFKDLLVPFFWVFLGGNHILSDVPSHCIQDKRKCYIAFGWWRQFWHSAFPSFFYF